MSGSGGLGEIREHERVVVIMVVVGGVEVDARATLQGSKEGRCHVGSNPVCHSVQFVA